MENGVGYWIKEYLEKNNLLGGKVDRLLEDQFFLLTLFS